MFGVTQVRLDAVGPTLPLDSPEYTALKIAIAPSAVNTAGAGSYTGSARVRGREHAAAATIALQATGWVVPPGGLVGGSGGS